MKVKLIRAATMSLAFAEAYRLLGPDALILSNRRVDDMVEVTVAADPEQPPNAGNPDAQPGIDEKWSSALAFHKVPPRLAEMWIAKAPVAALAASFRFGKVSYDRPLLLAGPPGAGKTMTTIKLATRLVLDGVRPTIINADHNRAGAGAQLAALSRILKAEFIDTGQSVTNPVRPHRQKPNRARPVLIDLPGMDPFSENDMEELSAMIKSVGGVAALVLPAGLDATESGEIAERFHAAGATSLIPTRLDLSRRLGGMIAAADAAPLTLTDAGTSGRVSDGLRPLTPRFLATRLLGHLSEDRVNDAA